MWDLAEGEEGEMLLLHVHMQTVHSNLEVKDINIVMPQLLKLACESYVICNSGYQLSQFLLN
jgi:hypothetical protein